jgi:hypothetical protein
MDHKTYMKVTTAIFAIVAVGHAFRVFNGWDVMVGPYDVPAWVSIVGVGVAGFLAWTGYKSIK